MFIDCTTWSINVAIDSQLSKSRETKLCLLCSCSLVVCYKTKICVIIEAKYTIRNFLRELTNFTSTCALEIVSKKGKLSEL
jgi:hypothetical protein